MLLTEAALRWVGVDPTRAQLVAHTERYEHLGDVRYFVRDLGLDAAHLHSRPAPEIRDPDAVPELIPALLDLAGPSAGR
jgi:hypothetical protein